MFQFGSKGLPVGTPCNVTLTPKQAVPRCMERGRVILHRSYEVAGELRGRCYFFGVLP